MVQNFDKISETVEKFLSDSLCFNLKIYTDNKVFTKNKLINFSIDECIITLTIDNKNKNNKIKFFIPFDLQILKDGNIMMLDYTVNSYCRYDGYHSALLNITSKKISNNIKYGISYFFDSKVFIEKFIENFE
jgi:methionine aminopeptidase